MSGKNINFEDKKIKKQDFHKNKKAFKIDDVDVNKILISKEEACGTNESFKYFIVYNDNDDIRPLSIMLPQTIGYVKCFESNKTMSLKISENKLFKKYIEIWKKVKNLWNMKFDSEPVCGDINKYIKTKIDIYDCNVNTNLQCKKVAKENASYKC